MGSPRNEDSKKIQPEKLPCPLTIGAEIKNYVEQLREIRLILDTKLDKQNLENKDAIKKFDALFRAFTYFQKGHDSSYEQKDIMRGIQRAKTALQEVKNIPSLTQLSVQSAIGSTQRSSNLFQKIYQLVTNFFNKEKTPLDKLLTQMEEKLNKQELTQLTDEFRAAKPAQPLGPRPK